MAVQLSLHALERIVASQHAAQLLGHWFYDALDGRRNDLVVCAPRPKLKTSVAGSATEQLTLHSRVLFNQRQLNNKADLGNSATADVVAQAHCTLSTGNPGSTAPSVDFNIDWSATSRADITVNTADPAIGAAAQDAILRYLALHRGYTFTLPRLGPPDAPVTSLGFAFRNFANGAVVNIGLNVTGAVGGSTTAIDERFVTRDWALAFSRSYFLDRLRSRLDEEIPVPQQVARKCTTRSPWGDCWNRMTVTLEELDVDLENGHVLIEGALDIHNSGALIPDAAATFTAEIELSVNNSGQIQSSVSNVDVDVSGFFAELANFLGRGFIADRIENAVRSALNSSSAAGGNGFFTSMSLNEIASGKTGAAINLSVRAKSISVRSNGVVLHGDIQSPRAEQGPEAFFTVTEVDDPVLLKRTRVFNAVRSWTPGSTVARYKWEFSDGVVQEFVGSSAKFLTSRVADAIVPIHGGLAPPGWGAMESTCLTVIDVNGRSEKTCYTIVNNNPDLIIGISLIFDILPHGRQFVIPRAVQPVLEPETLVLRGGHDRALSLKRLSGVMEVAEALVFSRDERGHLRRPEIAAFGFDVDPLGLLGRDVRCISALARSRQVTGLELVYPRFPEEVVLVISAFRGLQPAIQAVVRIRSMGGAIEAKTNDKGFATFILKASDLGIRASGHKDSSLWAFGSVVVTAECDSAVSQTLRIWLTLESDRQKLARHLSDELLQMRARLLGRVGGLEFFVERLYEDVSVRDRECIREALVGIETLRAAVSLIHNGAAIEIFAKLVGIAVTDRTPADLDARLDAVAKDVVATIDGINLSNKR